MSVNNLAQTSKLQKEHTQVNWTLNCIEPYIFPCLLLYVLFFFLFAFIPKNWGKILLFVPSTCTYLSPFPNKLHKTAYIPTSTYYPFYFDNFFFRLFNWRNQLANYFTRIGSQSIETVRSFKIPSKDWLIKEFFTWMSSLFEVQSTD